MSSSRPQAARSIGHDGIRCEEFSPRLRALSGVSLATIEEEQKKRILMLIEFLKKEGREAEIDSLSSALPTNF